MSICCCRICQYYGNLVKRWGTSSGVPLSQGRAGVHQLEPLPCSWALQPSPGLSLPLYWAAARKRRFHLLLLSLWLPASIQLQSGSYPVKAQRLWATVSSHRPCICCASNMTLRPHPVTHPGHNNVNQASG